MTETVTRKVVENEADLNRDPISGTPGAHPVGTGAGAASGRGRLGDCRSGPGQLGSRLNPIRLTVGRFNRMVGRPETQWSGIW